MRKNVFIILISILAFLMSGCSLDASIYQLDFLSRIETPELNPDQDPTTNPNPQETLTVKGPPSGELPLAEDFLLTISGPGVTKSVAQVYEGSITNPSINISGLVPGNLVTFYTCTMGSDPMECSSLLKFTATKSSHNFIYDHPSAISTVLFQVSVECKDNLKIPLETSFMSYISKVQDSSVKPNNSLAYLYSAPPPPPPPLPPAPTMQPLVLAIDGPTIDSKKVFKVSLQEYGQYLPDQRGYSFKLFKSANCAPGTEVSNYGADLKYSGPGATAPYKLELTLDQYGSSTPSQNVVLSALQENVNGTTSCSNSVTYSYQKSFEVNFKHYAYSAKYESPYPTPTIEISLSEPSMGSVKVYYSFGNSTHDLTGFSSLDQYVQVAEGQTTAVIPMPLPPTLSYSFADREINFFEMNLQYVGQGLGTIGKYSSARIAFTPPSNEAGYQKIADIWGRGNNLCVGRSSSSSMITSGSFYECYIKNIATSNWISMAPEEDHEIPSANGFKKFFYPVYIGADGYLYHYNKMTRAVSLFDDSRTYKDLTDFCALGDNSRVYCWGKLANQTEGYDPVLNEPVEMSTTNYTALAPRNDDKYSQTLQCALTAVGSVDCWRKDSVSPVETFSNVDGFTYSKIYISHYRQFSWSIPEISICGLRSADGSFYCNISGTPKKLTDSGSSQFKDIAYYGDSPNQWIGIDTSNKTLFLDGTQLIQPSGVDIQKVIRNYWISCFLDINAVVFCSHNYMQSPYLGYELIEKHKNFKYIRNSSAYSFGSTNRVCAIDQNDALFCAGIGEAGNAAMTSTAIGDGTGYRREHLVRIDPAYTYKNVSINGRGKNIGIRTDGTAVSWGFQENDNGVGLSSGNVNEIKPIVIDSTFKYIYMEDGKSGLSLTCGLTITEGDGFNRVRCRNFRVSGGAIATRSQFYEIANGKKFNYLGVTDRFVHLVDQDGKLYLYDDRTEGLNYYPYDPAKTVEAVDLSETYQAWYRDCGLTTNGKFKCAATRDWDIGPVSYVQFPHPENFVTLGPDNCAIDINNKTYCFSDGTFTLITTDALTTFKVPGAGCGITMDNKISCKVNHTVMDESDDYKDNLNIRNAGHIYSPLY